ncbi:MAG: TIGR04053 family radical SAM/SPASM domain-containing protein [Nitrospinota bacterium]|nr:TIGR04053 family radical SAM/SPASM domain-containing protein [Nitrospinota bacterium]
MDHAITGTSTEVYGQLRFEDSPRLVYWELTRACDLACRHCRAEAIPERDPNELDTEEGGRLLEDLLGFGKPAPHLVLTGGDPLKRPDFFELLECAIALSLRTSVAPSGTPNLTREVLRRLKTLGVQSIALSLDGSTAGRHDGLRGVPGCFDRTVEAARDAGEQSLPMQINTLVTADTLEDMESLYALVSTLNVARWSLFTLVPTGRGAVLPEVSPERCETFFHWLYDRSREAPFAIATTEAPHFRRVALTRMQDEGRNAEDIRRTPVGMGFGIRDGNGILFVSHVGEVFPSGFLPVAAGNVRTESPVTLYRSSELFRNIRETERYAGKCGWCEFRNLCGGSRARSYAATGDPLGSDPLCAYEPASAAPGLED